MENKTQKKEKIIMMKLKKPSILTVLVGITLILTLVNFYLISNLTQRLDILSGEGAVGALRESQPQQPEQQPTRIDINVDNRLAKGALDAPVTIVEFSCFECPFCARFFQETLPQIEENYINTGKVKFVYRHFPLAFHSNAQKAHEAAECANEQGKFWEYHGILYENIQALEVANLKKYAENLGLNVSQFNECLDSGKMADEVEKDAREAQGYGVEGTPTFFINGIKLVGAQPYQVFEQIIEQELNKSR